MGWLSVLGPACQVFFTHINAPTLVFSLFFNGFEVRFMSDKCLSPDLNMLNLIDLKYKDDLIVIFTETPEGL
jgi:hypothetical protein